MEFKLHSENGIDIVELIDKNYVIKNSQDFLDLISNAPSKNIAIYKENIAEEFFDLKTGLAGEILQKTSNYGLRMGIIGNFSRYSSKSFRDFIYKSNKTGQVIFVDTVNEVIKAFCKGYYINKSKQDRPPEQLKQFC